MTPIKELSCSGCGGPLEVDAPKAAEGSRSVVSCEYCGQDHIFSPAPPVGQRARSHRQGDSVVVEWGGRWWAARVVADLGGDVWKVHYEGWADSWDEAVGNDRIRADTQGQPATARRPWGKAALGISMVLVLASIAVTTLVETRPGGEEARGAAVDSATPIAVGQPVQIEWNGSWFPGLVLAVHSDGRVRVHYGGWADSYDEDVPRDRLRVLAGGTVTVEPRGDVATAESELSVGQPVQVDWNGSWYAATVLALTADGGVRIHYEGWADSFDEDVPRSRIRAPGGG